MTEASVKAIRHKVFVRGLEVQAEIGLYAHEHGVRQPLVCDVEMEVEAWGAEVLAETVNYERVRDLAKSVTAAGHWKLVESFAQKLGEALMQNPRILTCRVRVEKPTALRPDAAAAGVEITLARG